MLTKIRTFVTPWKLLLLLILGLALFVRVYRVEDLLGFYYDQGRDALVVWRLLMDGRPFLIGPVTGLAGIFLGPFYYYLITPFYLLSGGDPVLPAVFLAFLSVVGVFMLYYLGLKFQDRTTGLIAATVGGLSYYLVLAGRWLSNPTPIMLTSMILLWAMWKVLKRGGDVWWILISLMLGLSLQMESASAVFYLPMVLIFAVWQRKNLPDKKIIKISTLTFLATLSPQIIFNFRHDNILVKNLINIFLGEKSFRLNFWEVANLRLSFLWTVYYSKILPENRELVLLFTIPSFYFLFSGNKKLKREVILLLIFILIPTLGYFLFQGNQGNIYDYYMTGYYFPLVLLFSLGLGVMTRSLTGKLFVLSFLIIFTVINGMHLKNYLSRNIFGEDQITLGNELVAVDWVFEDAKNRGKFNVDFYVPPVIPYSYEYLFLWKDREKCRDNSCGVEREHLLPLLYTLYEADPPHPFRLEEWLSRQRGIGVVEDSAVFGGITVQRRKRL